MTEAFACDAANRGRHFPNGNRLQRGRSLTVFPPVRGHPRVEILKLVADQDNGIKIARILPEQLMTDND